MFEWLHSHLAYALLRIPLGDPLHLAVGVQYVVYGPVWDVHARASLDIPLHAGRAGPAPRVQAGHRAVLAAPRQAA